MSQPPKSTMRAFNPRWTEFRGVVRSAGAAGMKIQANSTEKGVSNLTGQGHGADRGGCGSLNLQGQGDEQKLVDTGGR